MCLVSSPLLVYEGAERIAIKLSKQMDGFEKFLITKRIASFVPKISNGDWFKHLLWDEFLEHLQQFQDEKSKSLYSKIKFLHLIRKASMLFLVLELFFILAVKQYF